MEDLRQKILGAQDVPSESLYVAEWDCSLVVRGLTARERDRFEEEVTEKGMANMRARLVVRSVFTEAGERIFNDKDMAALGEKSAVAVNQVFEVAARLNGLTDRDVEDLEKNSESAPTDSSDTD